MEGGGGVGRCTRKETSYRMGTHVHRIHQPIINSRLETFEKAIFLLTNYRNSSNYQVGTISEHISPSNHHDSPIRFLLLFE